MAKILVAEDDKLASGTLVEALKAAGFETLAAYDGEEALKEAKEQHPDLVILDVGMPKLDGISVLWELKADRSMVNTRIMVLTNMGDVDTIGKIVEAGVVDYLVKGETGVDQVVTKAKEILARQIPTAD